MIKLRLAAFATLAFLLVSVSTAAAPKIEGTWVGTLQTGASGLRLVINLSRNPQGKLVGTLDSPDQGSYGTPLDEATFEDGKLHCEMRRIAGAFDGRLQEPARLVGTWTQMGRSFPLTLQPGKRTVAKRPQEPVKPYPYVEEEVTYESRKPSRAWFAGTLTKPKGSGPFPAALLITGSGSQNRDEELMGHKPFLVLADALTRRGVAVLRVDDRGVGGSVGDTTRTTMRDYVQDALAGVAFLKARPDIDRRRIGVIGHSEGGMIASAAAAQSDDVAFIVMIAAPGVRGADILVKQNELSATVSRLPGSVVEFSVSLVGELNELILGEPDDLEAADKIDEFLQAKTAAVEAMDIAPEEKALMTNSIKATRAQVRGLISPWMRYFLGYDPIPTLKRVHCPVLALNGSLDMQVPSDQNLPLIEAALAEGEAKDYQVIRLAGLNHVLQTAVTGSPAEYGSIEETISPSALEVIGEWVAARAGIPAASGKSH